MSELLYYDTISGLNSLGYKELTPDYNELNIDWIEDLNLLLNEDEEE